MTSYDEAIIETIGLIKEKNIPLYQAIPKKDFSIAFFKELIALSKKLEAKGLKDFKVRTTSGFTTVQTFGVASALTYLKMHNEHLNSEDFIANLGLVKDGYFQFGYLLSSTINEHLSLSDDINIYPYKEIEESISAINRSEIRDFLDHTSPEFIIHKDSLAALLINIPLLGMVFEGEKERDEISNLPIMLANEKLKDIQELISLISDNAIEILISWGSYSDDRLDYLLGLTPNKNREYYSEGGRTFFKPCMAKTRWDSSKEFYELILKNVHSKELKIALDRVFSSMSNTDFMGKVLDLSVAMEVMCVSGRGDNTYKVANHISWLCTQDPNERLKIMKSVKDFYNLRSSIVHEGKYSSSATKSYGGENQLYDVVLVHIKKALFELLKYGEKPNWNTVVANGGSLYSPEIGTQQKNQADAKSRAAY